MNGLISQQDYRLIAVLSGFVMGIAFLAATSLWFFLVRCYNPHDVKVLRIPFWLTVSASLFGMAIPFFHEFGVIGESQDLGMAVSGSIANAFTVWIISIAVWRCGWNRRAFAVSMSGITLLMLPMAVIDTVTELKLAINGYTHIVFEAGIFLGACFIYQSFKAADTISEEGYDGH